jgi:ABC-2 type transport system permease protein
MRELVRAALVIARRDFAATVLTRSFLFFLLAPLFPLLVGLTFGGLTVNAARGADNRNIVVIAGQAEFAALQAARSRLSDVYPGASHVQLMRVDRAPDAEAQRQRILAQNNPRVAAVLDGGLAAPRLSSVLPPGPGINAQVELLVEYARAAPAVRGPPVERSVSQCPVSRNTAQRPLLAQAAQGLLFILTILLATMLLSQLIEEKASKIIEVLAAAVPVESIFLGKLLAMLAVSVFGIAVWTMAGATAFALLAERGLQAIPEPAVGWPTFILLGLVYFAMSYLLLGAVFLGIGAHAATARQVQILSMPVTLSQVLIFAVAALAVGEPNSREGLAAAVFPLSSPYVMIARAAQLPELWPQLLAILWQLFWVGAILHIAARLFRRSVLKSGPVRRRKAARA